MGAHASTPSSPVAGFGPGMRTARGQADVFAELRRLIEHGDIDIVFHGLTWTFAREMSRDIQFGPIVFYDGQAFLVKKRLGAKNMGQLLGRTICVQDNSDFLVNLQRAYREKRMVLKTVAEKTPAAAQSAFFTGRCDALTADASALATILAARGVDTDDYVILPDRISKEPLAPIMRRDDDDFADVVRWTFFALVDAEELGITAMNVDKAKVSDDPKVRAFLTEASTRAGLAAGWTAAVIANVGNYGELYERHLGQGTAAHLDRGPNDLWTRGGLMLTPPFH